MEMSLFLRLLLSLVSFVQLAAGCEKSASPLKLHVCTKKCLFDEANASGPCATNLRGLCEEQDHNGHVVEQWMVKYQACLVRFCAVSDQDLYDVLNTFRVECEKVASPFPSTLPGEEINDWLTAATRSEYTTRVQTMTGGATSTSGEELTTTMEEVSSSLSSVEDGETMTSKNDPATSTSDSTTPTSTANEPNTTDIQSVVIATDHDNPNPDNTAPTTLLLSTTVTAFNPISSTHAHLNATTPSPSPPLSTAAISGTAAGGACVLTLTIGLTYYLLRRKSKSKPHATPPDYWLPDREPKRPNCNGSMRALAGVQNTDAVSPERFAPVSVREKDNSMPVLRGGGFGGNEIAQTSYSARAFDYKRDGDGVGVEDLRFMAARSPVPMWGGAAASVASPEKGKSVDVYSDGLASPVLELGSTNQAVAELHHESVVTPIMSEPGRSTTYTYASGPRNKCTPHSPDVSELGTHVRASGLHSTPISPTISELGTHPTVSELDGGAVLSPVSELGCGQFDDNPNPNPSHSIDVNANNGPKIPELQSQDSESSIPQYGRHWDRARCVELAEPETRSAESAQDGVGSVLRLRGANIAQNF
ncbi:hypothetical protein T440DRAFT_518418 [Plenodomus tracheiphilus IPT5]|uniref:Extracellular membrane protein CFEM domain-containing protein n=1 Tax=Plenodomus tracheiphilus IPT5 TaxID=1408161 RepID=A0A6A7B485_9PLEO|nr:hypothetical protein T440DRAFT_518418 [Plenodomus tracheiphilus IPT5]